MRRPWFWVSSLALLVAAVLILILTERPPGDFAFLRGRSPVSGTKARAPSFTVYTFEADFDALHNRAASELEQLGYSEAPQITSDPSKVFAVFSRMEVVEPPIVSPLHVLRGNTIAIYKDTRCKDNQTATDFVMGNRKGWVTVTVALDEPPTLLERLRSSIGL